MSAERIGRSPGTLLRPGVRLSPPSVSLAARMLVATGVLALLVAGVFVVLLLAAASLRDATRSERRSSDVTAAALALEKLVLDLETGARGLAITGNERFLEPWSQARAELPRRLVEFERLAAADVEQQRRARTLVNLIRDYVDTYSVPLVEIARESPAAARSPVATAEGKRQIDAIRRRFARFLATERALAAESAATANARFERATVLGVAGLGISAALIVLFGLYLARSIARSVREVASGASRLAEGDLSVRLVEGGPGEVGQLIRAFNAMARALEQSSQTLALQNAKLRESERLKSELVGVVSHELRTPLTSVLGFTSLLLRRDVDAETRRRYLEIIDAEARRLGNLVDDLLDLERIEEGGLELRREVVDLSAILRAQAQLYLGQSDRHTLELSLRDERLLTHGDPERLAQVVGNLLSNAIKYSPDGGPVRVTGERDSRSVRVRVRDEGFGIADEHQPRVFTKFFRGDAAERGISGTGLGLALARDIVEAHGGRIGFVSTRGGGSTFWIELPSADGNGLPAAERYRR